LRWLVLLGLLFAILYATKMSTLFSRRVLLTWAVMTPIPLIVVNIILNEMLRRFMMATGNVRLAVVAGFNEVSVVLAERIYADPTLGIRIAGYFDDRSADRLKLPANQKLLGGLSDLASYVNTHRIDVIFIALPMRQVQRVVDLLDELRDTTSSIYFVPDIFVMDLIQSRTADVSGVPVIAMCETPFQGMPGIGQTDDGSGIQRTRHCPAVAVPADRRAIYQAGFARAGHLPSAPLRTRRTDH
jgi:putative colanic acid biosynthesis UDP-glucose lipid carrier transferase